MRVEHPGPLGNKGRVHTCLLNRLLASFTAVVTRRCYKLLSPFISARLKVMNQRHVSWNGEKNLSKITFSLCDDNICRISVILMYCRFDNAKKHLKKCQLLLEGVLSSF